MTNTNPKFYDQGNGMGKSIFDMISVVLMNSIVGFMGNHGYAINFYRIQIRLIWLNLLIVCESES